VYSFGLVMWECLAHEVPFAGLGTQSGVSHTVPLTLHRSDGVTAAAQAAYVELRPTIPDHLPQALKACVTTRCWLCTVRMCNDRYASSHVCSGWLRPAGRAIRVHGPISARSASRSSISRLDRRKSPDRTRTHSNCRGSHTHRFVCLQLSRRVGLLVDVRQRGIPKYEQEAHEADAVMQRHDGKVEQLRRRPDRPVELERRPPDLGQLLLRLINRFPLKQC
jgi:hypothetical protein